MPKVNIVDEKVMVPKAGIKPFSPNVKLLKRHVDSSIEFAKQMTFGEGYHQPQSFAGDSHKRQKNQIFRDALQGKLAEFAIHTFLYKKGIKTDTYPSCEVWGKGIWEDCDFTLKNGSISISVKSTKHFGNLLLLECHRYNQKGLYLEPANSVTPIKHDIIVLVRVKGVENESVESYNNTSNIECEITGFITHFDFCKVIAQKQIINKGIKIGIPMIVDNYYVCANDLHKADNFTSFI
jgi:hypothetical protein